MAGIVGTNAVTNTHELEAALSRIEHRGGSGKSVRVIQGATFGQVWPRAQEQLAIGIEGHAVALDGEIHNWTDLCLGATSPLEAVEEAYRAEGPRFVSKLDGPFALAIAGSDGLFLARDRVGKSPLYYGRRNGALCFASELKALAGWAQDIAEFPPGHTHVPDRGVTRYANIEQREPLDLPAEEVAAELRDRLVASVSKRTDGDEFGAWLSGGLDSACMTALASRQHPNLHTFAVGLEGAPDLEYARTTASFVGSRHHELVCTLEEMLRVLPTVIYHLESFDALLVRSSITNFLVGKLAADYVPAVLSGEGGDELFAGYSYLKALDPQQIPAELVDITRRLHNTALQRVDRCSAGHGLVARTPFLDQDVVDYALRIPPEMKLHGDDQTEKWILRQAMEGLLPEEVRTRTKAKFWEGAGVGDLLAVHANEAISDAEFEAERQAAPQVRLNTKEELFYYRIFAEHFGATLPPDVVGRTKGAPSQE